MFKTYTYKRRRRKDSKKHNAAVTGKHQIQTLATKQNSKAATVIPEVVTYLDPKKRIKKDKTSLNVNDDHVESEKNISEVSMKQARWDVFKFGVRGLDKEGQHEARVALALKLGAKPEKNKCLPYADYKAKQMIKKDADRAQKEMERLTGMRKASTIPVSTKKKGKKVQNETTEKKKKSKRTEATPLKLGKFDGATLRLSSKDLSKMKGRK